MAERPVILVGGDAQAQGVAMALNNVASLAGAYDVRYSDRVREHVPKEDLARCSFFLEQSAARSAPALLIPRSGKRVTFPALRLGLLWPLAVPNPYDTGPPGSGDFPWTNSFIAACVRRGLPADEIMQHYEGRIWSPEWPNLDTLFKAEADALMQADAKCDVKIGSFVLKNFRKRRLFWAINAPTNALLCELAYRLLHACFGREAPADRDAIGSALRALGTRELMEHVELPVQPYVAEHFALEWYQGTPAFGEYYRRMIAYLYERHAQSASRSAPGEK